jgi:CheY-like chemotaxis protein
MTLQNLPHPSKKSVRALPQSQSNPRQRILVVDDDADIRRLNTDLLRCCGYHVDSAEDGAIAWNVLQQNRYDLLVTDHKMPKISGVELMQKLHATRLAQPVILVTGKIPEEELSRHPWLKIHATLLKPYTFKQLFTAVKDVLYATADTSADIAPPNWQRQPSSNVLQT